MKEEENHLSSLEARHRKEKKELQAQIQALKKTAKNDKTKKKEMTAEIARLETELENRQKQEYENISTKETDHTTEESNNTPIQQIENGIIKVKMSKAQKRRDKKSQQEKERAEQIKLQEIENLHGPRNMEIQTISAKLKERNLKIFPIPSDGDCLYKAIAHQLAITRQRTLSVDELRKNVAHYIKENKNDFIPFMSNPDTHEMLTDVEFEDYCNKILNTKVWGGQLEIRALSSYLKCPITVIQATGPDSIEQGNEFAGPPLIITYHRHMYSLGEHYNSTHCLSEVVNENN